MSEEHITNALKLKHPFINDASMDDGDHIILGCDLGNKAVPHFMIFKDGMCYYHKTKKLSLIRRLGFFINNMKIVTN